MPSRMKLARLQVKLKKIKQSILGILKLITPKEPRLSAVQQETFNIIRTLINHSDALLLYAPISTIYHIEYENIFIRFNSMHCYVVNSKYSYYVELPANTADELANMFKRKMEKKSNEVLAVYESKMLDKLKFISSSLVNK